MQRYYGISQDSRNLTWEATGFVLTEELPPGHHILPGLFLLQLQSNALCFPSKATLLLDKLPAAGQYSSDFQGHLM